MTVVLMSAAMQVGEPNAVEARRSGLTRPLAVDPAACLAGRAAQLIGAAYEIQASRGETLVRRALRRAGEGGDNLDVAAPVIIPEASMTRRSGCTTSSDQQTSGPTPIRRTTAVSAS